MELSNEQYRQMVNWMDQQRRRVAELEAENRELRHQLDELRRGVGVSLVIQGRALPVSVLPAPVPTGPIAMERPSYPAYSAPLQAQLPRTPQTPPSGQVSPATHPTAFTSRPASAPDSNWLTGRMRAVRAPAPQASASQPSRQAVPSQDMTPTWLREEVTLPAPVLPSTPIVPSWPATPPPPASRPRTLASATSKQPAVHSPLYQGQAVAPASVGRPRRQTVPRLEPEYLPSLAQMTGRSPAVRVPANPSEERSPYSDSFVLG